MIDLTLPGDALTASLVDVPSVSGGEGRLADEVEAALKDVSHLVVERDGDAIRSMTASPAFMSDVPQPNSRSPSRRLGRLSATGTVSR